MNDASFVGAGAGDVTASSLSPIRVEQRLLKAVEGVKEHVLTQLTDEQRELLTAYLLGRLSNGSTARDKRIIRYAKIDRLISTWQKLSPEDSQREMIEDNTGRQAALPFNLPVLASHLNDMVSYFAEALAPVSNPFFSANGAKDMEQLLAKFNRDAAARDYYGELNLTLRSLMKYNIGGFRLCWDDGKAYGRKVGEPGNHWKSLDMYNTLWDPSIRDPKRVAQHGEWAATVCLENRLELLKRSIAGEWVGLDGILSAGVQGNHRGRFYKEPALLANMGDEGQDTRTSSKKEQEVNWGAFGLSLSTDLGPEVDGFEVADMEIWLIPAQFGLLTNEERADIESKGLDPEMHLEPWRFVFVNEVLVDAKPTLKREMLLQGERVELPFYISFLTQDQLKEAQRSFMELMRGFQRFASSMYNIYVEGMRKNVWGLTVYDPSMIDASALKNGGTTGLLPSKERGRDVRTGLSSSTPNAGVDQAIGSVDNTLALKDRFFPSQALPGQVAGIDRAVKSQVHTVVQGATRAMRTLLRTLDSTLMLPSRMGGYRNLKRFDPEGVEALKDEDVAKLMGSGIESMEAERVSELLWQLLYAIIQNQESMQLLSVPEILSYLSRVNSLGVDLGQFARQPAQPQAPTGAEGQPVPTQPTA